MKRIIIEWSGSADYLAMLLSFIGSEIKKGQTKGMAHGYLWRIEEDRPGEDETEKETIDSWSIVMTTVTGKQVTIAPDDIGEEISEEVDRLIEEDLKYPVTWRGYE